MVPASTQPSGNSQHEPPGALLPAFRASLTDPGSISAVGAPSSCGLPLPVVDVFVPTAGRAPADTIELGDDITPARDIMTTTHSARDEEFIALRGCYWADDSDPGIGRLTEFDDLTDNEWQA